VTGLPCPNCGSELAFLEQYGRHYCYMCGRYAPEGYGDRDAQRCPTCSGVLSFVVQYDRFYCYRCNAYPAPEAILPAKESAVPAGEGTAALLIAEPVASIDETGRPTEVAETPREGTHAEEQAAEETPAPIEKPSLVREEILEAKKPVLMDLSKAYGLDPAGTKDQLRERLLSYLDETEAAERPEVEPEPIAEWSVEPEEIRAFPEPESAPERDDERIPEVIRAERQESEPPSEAPAIGEAQTLMEPELRPAYEEPSPATEEPARMEAVAVVAPPLHREVPRVEHPCPTCGRELTYVSQYNRWYCYDCRAYAPVAKSKNACPNCGATLRWIGQYERWWCDACRKYAPANLPRPQGTAAGAVESRLVAQEATQAIPAHRHRNPGSGIGLVGLGLVLFVLYEIFVDLPAILSINVGFIVTSDVAFALRFFAFAFVAVGAIMGLAAVRDRH